MLRLVIEKAEFIVKEVIVSLLELFLWKVLINFWMCYTADTGSQVFLF